MKLTDWVDLKKILNFIYLSSSLLSFFGSLGLILWLFLGYGIFNFFGLALSFIGAGWVQLLILTPSLGLD